MSRFRVLVTSKVTLAKEFRVDGVLTDPAGDVMAVLVERLDGTDVQTGNATKVSTGKYTFAVNASAELDHWVVVWSGSFSGTTVKQSDIVEHVGGFFFDTTEANDYLKLGGKYSATDLAAKRIEVEQEAELICNRAFVPRYARYTLSSSGSDQLGVPDTELRKLRSVTVGGVAWSPSEVAQVALRPHGVLVRPGSVWPVGDVTVEYEHGWDYPPERVRTNSMLRLKSILGRVSSGVPDRASSYTTQDGATYRLTMPGPRATGIPDVDAAYQASSRRKRAAIA